MKIKQEDLVLGEIVASLQEITALGGVCALLAV
jgi:hypothetical protein